MKTIVVSTEKGGVGKTTLALHLAWYFADQNKRVVLLDLDPQANASSTLREGATGIEASRLFTAEALPVLSAPVAPGSVALISADRKLVDVERIDPYTREPIRLEVVFPTFKKQLASLAEEFDVCVVDTPPNSSLKATAALFAAGWVVSPVDLEQWGMDGIAATIRTVEGTRQKLNPNLVFCGLLPSRFDATSQSQKATLLALLKNYSRWVLPAKLSRRLSFAAIGRTRAPVWKDGSSSGREATAEMLRALKLIEEKVDA